MNVLLDTSAIRELASDPIRAARFRDVARQAWTVWLADLALQEIAGDPDPRRREALVVGFGGALSDLPDGAVRVSAAHDEAIRWELNNEPVRTVLPSRWEERYVEVLLKLGRHPEQWSLTVLPGVVDHQKTWKEEFYQKDRGLHDWLSTRDPEVHRWTSEDIAPVIYSTTLPSDDPLTAVAQGWSGGRWIERDFVAKPERFPVLTTWRQFFQRQCLANAVPDERWTPEHRAQFGCYRTRSANHGGNGDWFDFSIAASATHADLFITGDERLIRRSEILRSLGVVQFQSATLNAVLS